MECGGGNDNGNGNGSGSGNGNGNGNGNDESDVGDVNSQVRGRKYTWDSIKREDMVWEYY